jgi:hypothetical protein
MERDKPKPPVKGIKPEEVDVLLQDTIEFEPLPLPPEDYTNDPKYLDSFTA